MFDEYDLTYLALASGTTDDRGKHDLAASQSNTHLTAYGRLDLCAGIHHLNTSAGFADKDAGQLVP